MNILQSKKWRIIIIVGAALLVIRLLLPYVILHYANEALAEVKGYRGHVDDINLGLIRGAYKIKKFYLNKKDSVTGEEIEFLNAPVIDLSIHWQALFKGKLAGELDFRNPSLIFTKDKVEPKQLVRDTNDLRKILKDFMPLDVNRFEVFNGELRYRDETSTPKVDIHMTEMNLTAENLTNVETGATLPATIALESVLYGGKLYTRLLLDPLAKEPTFDFNAELENTNLPELNAFFKAYGKFDVTRGIFGLYAEGAAKNNKFVGYVKPVIKDLKVIGPEDKQDNPLKKFWEAIVGTAGIVFRNLPHDQVATKIPLEGNFGEMDANIWYAMFDVLRNAFIQALQPSIDQEINLQSVDEGSLKLVEPDKGKKQKGKEEGKENGQEASVEKTKEKKGFLKKIFNKDKKEEEKK